MFPDGLILYPGHFRDQPKINPIQDPCLRVGRIRDLFLDDLLQHRRQVVLVTQILVGGHGLGSDTLLVLLEDVAHAELDRIVEFQEHVIDHQVLLLPQPVVAMLHQDL